MSTIHPETVTIAQIRQAAQATQLLASTEGPHLDVGPNRQYAATVVVVRQFAQGQGTVKRRYVARVELEAAFRRSPGWMAAPLKTLGQVAEATAYRLAFKTQLGSMFLADEEPTRSGPKKRPVAMTLPRPVRLAPVLGAVA